MGRSMLERWLPTIGREDLRLAGYYGWRSRGNDAISCDIAAIRRARAVLRDVQARRG